MPVTAFRQPLEFLTFQGSTTNYPNPQTRINLKRRVARKCVTGAGNAAPKQALTHIAFNKRNARGDGRGEDSGGRGRGDRLSGDGVPSWVYLDAWIGSAA